LTAVADYQSQREILEILRSARTVAVVGLSPDELRASNFVGFYLKRHGYRVVPVNPGADEILGERSYASVAEIPFPVDVVDVFRRAEAVPEIAEQAVAAGAGALWLQFGVLSFDGAEIARRGGLRVVMDRCLKVEHARHLGRMHWLGFNTWQVTARRAWDS
jgi:hypothetical protein